MSRQAKKRRQKRAAREASEKRLERRRRRAQRQRHRARLLAPQPSSTRFYLVPQLPAWNPKIRSWINGYGEAESVRFQHGSYDRQGQKRRFVQRGERG